MIFHSLRGRVSLNRGLFRVASAAALSLFIAQVTAYADDIAYMVTGSSEFGTIDLNTGVFSLINLNQGTQLAGLGELNGTLYGALAGPALGNPSLYRVNPSTGQLTPITTSPAVNYLEFGSTLTALYGIDGGFNLYSIDPLTGAYTAIGPTGLSFPLTDYFGMSTGSNTLYFSVGNSSSSRVYSLSTSTGAATPIGTSGPDIGAIVTEPDGITYLGSDFLPYGIFDTACNCEIATETGASPLNGPFWGLAPLFQISPAPEPSSVLLMLGGLLGAAVALLRRRRTAS